jgi:hypothetical protein
MAKDGRRRISRSRFYAKTTAARINFLSRVALSMANGGMKSPAARWKQPSSGGGFAHEVTAPAFSAVPNCDGSFHDLKVRNADRTNRVRISCIGQYWHCSRLNIGFDAEPNTISSAVKTGRGVKS